MHQPNFLLDFSRIQQNQLAIEFKTFYKSHTQGTRMILIIDHLILKDILQSNIMVMETIYE